jgi:multimeric flavodoxin WrbA
MRSKTSAIKPLNVDMKNYDTIIIATPVWASSPVPAVNAFVENSSFENKDTVFIISSASGDSSKAATLLTNKIQGKGGTVLQYHALKTNGLKEEDINEKAKEFAVLYK